MFAELEALSAQGHRFHALSEERGEVDFGDRGVRVIIDPIDGSLNAKRHACHYALSVAVADGETMADVAFGFVHDFGAGEEWWARRGEGAWLNGERLDPSLPERRSRDGSLELVGIESADPRWVPAAIERLWWPAPTGCGRWARSPPRCARSPPRASTAWSRSAAAGASTPPPAS